MLIRSRQIMLLTAILGALVPCSSTQAAASTGSVCQELPDAYKAMAQGRYADCEQICRRILTQDKENIDAHRYMAVALFHEGRSLEALNNFQFCLFRGPAQDLDYIYMGDCYTALGQTQPAILAYSLAVKASPRKKHAYEKLIQAYERAGNSGMAETVRQRANDWGHNLPKAGKPQLAAIQSSGS